MLDLFGMPIADIDTEGLLDHMFDSLEAGRGGWIVTANLDILRRFVLDPASRELYGQADIIVADGMPLVWASQLRHEPLPERVAGSSMTVDLLRRAAQTGRTVYMLGGKGDVAERAREATERDMPGLRIVGTQAPFISSPITPAETDAIVEEIDKAGDAPDIILVGFGSPKQEHAIAALRARYPNAWFIGIGITFSFLCNETPRAPVWMQKTGLEWLHRMTQEPKRLTTRYLRDDLPFFGLLMLESYRQGRDR
jgi:N-acetylglucosaminyldiphosphoundecaprenol N-acetyl-beta-D-mannosaminyltransferase